MLGSGQLKNQLLDRVVKHLTTLIPESDLELLSRFVRRYYGVLSLEDLAERAELDLAQMALTHWNSAYKKSFDSCLVRVYNPSVEKEGWSSARTVVEIAYKTISFLSESVRVELNRRGLHVRMLLDADNMCIQRNQQHEIVDVLEGV